MAPKLSIDRPALGISSTQFGRDASVGERRVLLVVSGIEEGKLEKTRREGSEPSDGGERTGGVRGGRREGSVSRGGVTKGVKISRFKTSYTPKRLLNFILRV